MNTSAIVAAELGPRQHFDVESELNDLLRRGLSRWG
jgi:hypothetical protein